MKHKILLLVVFISFTMSCEVQQFSITDESINDDNSVIYASEAPYYLTASTDCSQNRIDIQTVIDEASTSNKKLIIAKGTYCIDNTLFIPSDLEIDFSNATIERITGDTTVIFDLITNTDSVNGNTGITLKNLIINGNSIADGLHNRYWQERFSGLKLDNCTDVNLENITVKETVNAEWYQEPPAAGIFVLHSENITCNQIGGFDNFGTAISFWDSNQVFVNGSVTHDNIGSGLAASYTNNSEFINLTSYNNSNPIEDFNFSNITINGLKNKVLNVETWGSDATGLNIGHAPNDNNQWQGSPSDYTIIDNVHSYDNALDGITISYSKYILVSNIHLAHNKRHNLMIHDNSTHVQINNALIYGDPEFEGGITPFGIYINSGGRHGINNTTIFNNYHGIYIDSVTSPVSIGSEVFIYNNGSSASQSSSGIKIVDSQNVSINNPKIFCDQPVGSKRQNYGIYVSRSNNLFIRAQVWDNKTEQYYEENSTNTDVLIY